MFHYFRKLREKKEKEIDEQIAQINGPLGDCLIFSSLDENLAMLQKLFVHVDTINYKIVDSEAVKPARYLLVFVGGIVDKEIVNTNIVKPLMTIPPSRSIPLDEFVVSDIVQVGDMSYALHFQEVIENVTYGDSILFVEGCSRAVIIHTKDFALRGVTEPDNERTLVGPREGFTECMVRNLSQVMRRIRTHDLKAQVLKLGTRTRTTVCVCYLEQLAKKEILDELLARLKQIDIDGILDSNYINELIRDHSYSPFRATGYTERPDVVVGKLLEGRIAIFVDGTPIVLTVPHLFIENFQSSEDYYFSPYYTSSARMLRIGAFFLTVLVPGLYVAVTAFHQEMLPLTLLIRLASERKSVPLPAAIEAAVMLLVFDILRETGVRMPSNIGQTLSIVGALVIGQAAVEANLIAAPMIIVVAATGITGLLVPKMNAPIILCRIFVLILSSVFGFFGLTISAALILIHVNNLTSFGIEQLSIEGSFRWQANKDNFIRAPWKSMRQRPDLLTENKTRQVTGGGDNG